MNRATLVRRGLGFYRRTHLGVVAGCAVSAAVLVGALFVGDSVKGSLERIALARLGRIHVALDSGNRFFRETLAARIRDGLRTDVAAALAVPGMAIRDASRVNRVQVLGIDAQFLALAEAPASVKIGPGQAALNAKLANALGAKVGDDLRLRLIRPSLLSREAPLASQNEKDTRRNATVTVVAILGDAQLGRFSLRSDQAGPYSAFVDRAWLQETLDLPGRANLIVAGATSFNAQEWLRSAWTFEDLGVVFRAPEGRGVVQLESERVYLEPPVAGPAQALRPDHAAVLYYLVDAISAGGKSTPYSFVTAITPTVDAKLGPVPHGVKDDEILVNRWLADQLAVREGDMVKVAYSVPTVGNAFVPKSRDFKVRGVIEMAALAGEKELVPEFPGLTDVDACKDWKIGIPTEDEKLNDKANEKYWDTWRQTPKAFVTLAAGREMWANRHGDLMAVRYLSSATNQAEIKDKLRDPVDPALMGLVFQPVREAALRAATESMDLGQLFLGMSIFLVAASLILTAMFFVFSVEQRAKEMGVLFAVGYTTPQVRRLFLSEGAVLAVLGSAAGIPLGWSFARALVWGLGTAWSGAVADASIEFHARAVTAVIGAAAAAGISLAAMGVALWRQARRPVRELVAEDFSVSLEREALAGGGGGIRKAVFLAGLVGAAAVVVGTLVARVANPAGAFFGAGGLMLVSAVAGIRMRLATLSAPSTTKLSVKQLGRRNAARRPGRSLATAGMLASGCFVVFSVSVMKEDLATQAGERKSGTGGFRLYAESSLAIPHDLNGERGRKEFRLNDKEILEKVSIVPLRLREGDDASCLNLNQSLTPPLLGVDAGALGSLGAFAGPELWSFLDRPLPDGAVPALVGDSATAMWKLKKKVGKEDGDLLEYKDERGRPFRVKLVGALPSRLTVLQGRLLISQEAFTRLYPGEGGYRTFLVDVPEGREEAVTRYLSQRLETAGFDLTPSVERLKEFYVVESSYLRLFMVLGGLGLLLGSAGMGVLVLRHVMERRGELALLRAVGYTENQAAALVMAEHRFLVILGLVAGVAASAVSIVPTVLQPRSSLPFGFLAVFLLGTAILSLAWIRIATAVALRAPLVPALRHE